MTGIGTPPVNPEFIDAYEAGVKTSLAGGRVQLNGAAYYYNYSDLQVSRIEAGSLVTVNAAAAKIKGAEFDFLANATSQLQFRGGMTRLIANTPTFTMLRCMCPTLCSVATTS